MIRGLQTAASAMLAGQRRQEALTNNLTNAQTVGYKADESAIRSFPELLMNRIRDEQGLTINGTQVQLPSNIQPAIGPLSGGVYVHEVVPNFTPGILQRTGKELDVAIEKDAVNQADGRQATMFFTVQTPAGDTYYTRDGQWTVNDAGELVTYSGTYVLSQDGERINIGNRSVQISATGLMTLTNREDPTDIEQIQLGLALVEAPQQTLIKDENGYFRTNTGEALPTYDPLDADAAGWSFSIAQGALESSNVDLTRTMTRIIETYRYYEANQRVLQMTDSTLEKAASEIGRV